MAPQLGFGIAVSGLCEALRRPVKDGRGWFRTSDLSRVKRALSH
jgi:hypothetical protein